MKILPSLDKTYSCVQCGVDNNSVIQKDPKGKNHRLKCNSCGFLFNSQDADAAKEAGAIPSSSPETLAAASDPEVEIYASPKESKTSRFPSEPVGPKPKELAVFANKIPRTPSFVFVSKDRSRAEFCNFKEVKKVALKWEQWGKYDVFELNPKQFDVKVDIS